MRIGFRTAVLVSLLATSVLHAQSFEQLAGIRSVEPPSSTRSAAMGGTVDRITPDVSTIADDPSAAARLTRVAVSLAGTNRSYSTAVLRPVSYGTFSYEQRLTSSALSQFTIAAPLGRAVLSGYYLEQPRFHSAMPVLTPVAAVGAYDAPDCPETCDFVYSAETGFDRRDRQFGVAAAMTFGAVDVGLGLEARDLDERSGTARLILSRTTTEEAASDRLMRTTSGTAIVPTAAITWRPSQRVAVGASYKRGGTFTRTTTACATADLGIPQCRTGLSTLDRSDRRMPDTLRADVAANVVTGLQVAAAVVRRNYDTLGDESYSIAGSPGSIPYRSATETHAGAEYRFARVPVTLRAGWWRDPARLGSQFGPSNPWTEQVDHRTWGAALTISGSELALAVDDGGREAGRTASVGITHSF